MRYARFIVLLAIASLLFAATIAPVHIDPLLGQMAIGLRFVAFAAVSFAIGSVLPQKTGLAIIGSILLAGTSIWLRELFMGSSVAALNLISVVAGSVWGVALAHRKSGKFL